MKTFLLFILVSIILSCNTKQAAHNTPHLPTAAKEDTVAGTVSILKQLKGHEEGLCLRISPCGLPYSEIPPGSTFDTVADLKAHPTIVSCNADTINYFIRHLRGVPHRWLCSCESDYCYTITRKDTEVVCYGRINTESSWLGTSEQGGLYDLDSAGFQLIIATLRKD